LRFEELALDIWNGTTNLLHYLNLEMQPEIEDYLNIHINKKKFTQRPQHWNQFRDPTNAALGWRKLLTFNQIMSVQNECYEAMKLWGYKSVNSKKELLKLQPLLPLDLNQQ
jgi:hypothetical protein